MSETPWEAFPGEHPFNSRTLEETLVGGQAFRWFREPEPDTWTGVWSRNLIGLRLTPDKQLQVRRFTGTPMREIGAYLGIDRLGKLVTSLPCSTDPVLARLKDRWSGLSLLRQPPEETLLAFICSSNKQILQIRTMLHNLALRFGSRIPGTTRNSLPAWNRLAEVTESDLRACALGYRARHVTGTAAFLRQHPGFLDSINHLSLAEARSSLLQLPGVGPKVADCVLLFGFGRMEAFPVDTWIARLMVAHYPDLAGWTREQIATFARLHFGGGAGLAQQWLFAERNAR